MKTLLSWLTLIVVLFTLGCCTGCHPAPARVTLPSTVPVKRALAVATSDANNVVTLAKAVQQTGVKPGSAQGQALTLAATRTVQDLGVADGKVDQLSSQLLTAQKREDVLAQDDATKTALVVTEKRDWRHLLYAFLGFGLATVIAVSLAGAALEALSRAIETAVASALLKVGATAVHAAEEIPAVAATVVKVGAVAAVL